MKRFIASLIYDNYLTHNKTLQNSITNPCLSQEFLDQISRYKIDKAVTDFTKRNFQISSGVWRVYGLILEFLWKIDAPKNNTSKNDEMLN